MLEFTPDRQLIASHLNRQLSDIGWRSYRIDRDVVEADLLKLQRLSESGTVKKKSAAAMSIVNTVKHLWDLERHLSGDKYIYKLELQDRNGPMVCTAPFEMCKISELSVQTTDYIVLDGTTILEVNFGKALDTIAFEMCHQDAGISWEETEEAMKHMSLLGKYRYDEADILSELKYGECKSLMVQRSTFGGPGDMRTYFGDKVKDTKTYYRALMSTARKCGCFATGFIIDRLTDARAQGWQIVAVFEDSVQLLVDNKHLESVIKQLKDVEVVTKVHSRRIVTPLELVK